MKLFHIIKKIKISIDFEQTLSCKIRMAFNERRIINMPE